MCLLRLNIKGNHEYLNLLSVKFMKLGNQLLFRNYEIIDDNYLLCFWQRTITPTEPFINLCAFIVPLSSKTYHSFLFLGSLLRLFLYNLIFFKYVHKDYGSTFMTVVLKFFHVSFAWSYLNFSWDNFVSPSFENLCYSW